MATSMRRPLRALLVAPALAGFCAACSLVLGVRDLEPPPPEGEDVEAGPPIDAGDRVDASPPGADGSDGGEARGCASYQNARFCNDFDEISPFGTNSGLRSAWTQTMFDAATLTLLRDAGFSPPNAARFTIDQDAGCNDAWLERKVTGKLLRVRAHARIRWHTAFTRVLLLRFAGVAGQTDEIRGGLATDAKFYVTARSFRGDASGNQYQETPVETSLLDQWLDTELVVEAQPSRQATFRVGDKTATVPLPADMAFEGPVLHIGHDCENQLRSFDADDVAIEVEL
jgi:hypothetical protein